MTATEFFLKLPFYYFFGAFIFSGVVTILSNIFLKEGDNNPIVETMLGYVAMLAVLIFPLSLLILLILK